MKKFPIMSLTLTYFLSFFPLQLNHIIDEVRAESPRIRFDEFWIATTNHDFFRANNVYFNKLIIVMDGKFIYWFFYEEDPNSTIHGKELLSKRLCCCCFHRHYWDYIYYIQYIIRTGLPQYRDLY